MKNLVKRAKALGLKQAEHVGTDLIKSVMEERGIKRGETMLMGTGKNSLTVTK